VGFFSTVVKNDSTFVHRGASYDHVLIMISFGAKYFTQRLYLQGEIHHLSHAFRDRIDAHLSIV
jgi:hypothetical protein